MFHAGHYQTWYPGYQHELHLKILFNPLPTTGYVGIANFLENAQQGRKKKPHPL